MRCKKCGAKVRRYLVIKSFVVHLCAKCSGMQAYTPWTCDNGRATN